MMKEFSGFLKWQWQKFEFWQKCFIISSFFVGCSIFAPQPFARWLFIVPMLVVTAFMIKWVVWDGFRSGWEKYKQDRNSLLTTIKESDR